MIIHERPSPNHRDRKGRQIQVVVLHADASPSVAATLDWCRRPESKVSYHYVVGRTGNIYRLVPDDRAAYHAGVSRFKGLEVNGSLNDVSIGVCLSNRQDEKERFPEVQQDVGAQLVAALCERYAIPLLHVQMHSKVAHPPGRKRDPHPAGPFAMPGFMYRVQQYAGRTE